MINQLHNSFLSLTIHLKSKTANNFINTSLWVRYFIFERIVTCIFVKYHQPLRPWQRRFSVHKQKCAMTLNYETPPSFLLKQSVAAFTAFG